MNRYLLTNLTQAQGVHPSLGGDEIDAIEGYLEAESALYGRDSHLTEVFSEKILSFLRKGDTVSASRYLSSLPKSSEAYTYCTSLIAKE